ncbi:MAG: fatty acid desaturase [Planctomycetaceae bacterium]|nr:fatty acid desaturase [Planctomycetaceae bacterium]
MLHLAITCVAFALCYGVSMWFFPIAYMCAVRAVVIAHNHAHAPMFRWRWMNTGTDLLIQQITGFASFGWKHHHLMSHHQSPWTERDYSSPYSFETAHHPGLTISPEYYRNLYMPVFWCESLLCIFRRAKRAELIQLVVSLTVFATVHLALIAVSNPGIWFLTTLLTYAACGRSLGMSNFFQHWACVIPDDPSAPFDAWTFTNRRYNQFTFNQGYHMLHHLHPSMHWSDLPEAHRRDPGYTRPELVENGKFPGMRTPKQRKQWLEDKGRLLQEVMATKST